MISIVFLPSFLALIAWRLFLGEVCIPALFFFFFSSPIIALSSFCVVLLDLPLSFNSFPPVYLITLICICIHLRAFVTGCINNWRRAAPHIHANKCAFSLFHELRISNEKVNLQLGQGCAPCYRKLLFMQYMTQLFFSKGYSSYLLDIGSSDIFSALFSSSHICGLVWWKCIYCLCSSFISGLFNRWLIKNTLILAQSTILTSSLNGLNEA